MVKRIPISLIVVALIISLSLVVTWISERGSESNHAGVVAGKTRVKQQPIKDCDGWAGMNAKEKKRYYRADPGRWARCLHEQESSELDRVYITGKVSR